MQDGSIYNDAKKLGCNLGYIFATIKEKIYNEVRKFECISSRYKLPFCLLLVYFEGEEDITSTITSKTRCADVFVKIDNHYYALLFFTNRPDSHVKVSNKVMYLLETSFPGKKVSIGLACKEYSEEDVISQAIQNVLAAKSSDFNTIIDHLNLKG